MAADEEFNLELVVISTDSGQTHRAWTERREVEAPVTMLGDMTGMARMFGVLDTTTHTVGDWKGWAGSWRSGDVLDLVRDSFTVDVETEYVDSCE